MPRRKVRVAILSIEGTNNDEELHVALRTLGAQSEIVHLKQFEGRDVPKEEKRRLSDYQMLLLPGGFSAGDYVRAGAILAARVRSAIGPELEGFVRSGHFVGGICNGFQSATELGLLPGYPNGRLGPPQAALMTNDSGRYECRPTYLRWEGGRFAPLGSVARGTIFLTPSGHAEGKLVLSGDSPETRVAELEKDGQILFRWVDPEGRLAGYPWNPNGSVGNVAGITNREGNVFGLMPHPERAFFRVLHPDWTRSGERPDGLGDGARFFDSILSYVERHV
ncbi:MAG: phosphoribosylformylglycinamidine synthase subunit PurQ [Thermoplasmata archaeon]